MYIDFIIIATITIAYTDTGRFQPRPLTTWAGVEESVDCESTEEKGRDTVQQTTPLPDICQLTFVNGNRTLPCLKLRVKRNGLPVVSTFMYFKIIE